MKRKSVQNRNNGAAKRNVKTKTPSVAANSRDWGRIRLWAVGILFSLFWLALWGRVGYLQLLEGEKLAAMAQKQHIGTETIKGVRGTIYDRTGNVLARSVEAYSIGLHPRDLRDTETVVVTLAKILSLEENKLRKQIRNNRGFFWVKRRVGDAEARMIRAASLSGVVMQAEFDRVYPYESLAGQLLGFTNIDDSGIEGLEKACDGELSAMQLRCKVQRDARGGRLGGEHSDVTSLRGQDVYLTIDAQVQFFAEQALAEQVEKFEAKWGGCLVVDVPTGDVLAWAQYPFFNPNKRNEFSKEVRKNRIATDALEQGSTIKSFLIAAALEEKVVTPSTKVNCEKGKWRVGKSTIHDTHSYDVLQVSEILHVSSNIGVAKIGQKLGAKKYHHYLSRLGFGVPLGLPLAGQGKGILRAATNWQEIDLATASFGQSFSATLAQMAQAYLCLASDGHIRKLNLVLEEEEYEIDEKGKYVLSTKEKDAPERLFSPTTMRLIRSMLREVVEEEGGTGKQARIPGIIVGGKTGTAQKADKSGRYGRGRVGSFVGMVPIDNPRYLICVLLDEPTKNQYGGVIAAPVFRDVALRTMAYHGHLPDTDDPLVLSIAQQEAERKAKTASRSGAKASVVAKAQSSSEQKIAESGTHWRSNRQISADTVPDVVGLSVNQAIAFYAKQGVIPECIGTGSLVVRQEPPAGSRWPANKPCSIWLKEPES